MDMTELIRFLNKNKRTINISGIAKQLAMDASNFHKVIDGKLGLSDERVKKLSAIISKLNCKNA